MVPLHVVNDTVLVFDLDHVRVLRQLGIVGVLVGTLPRAPQQNVFLGLPLQLSIYEACWLVKCGHGEFVDSSAYHAYAMQHTYLQDTSYRIHLLDLSVYAVTPNVYQIKKSVGLESEENTKLQSSTKSESNAETEVQPELYSTNEPLHNIELESKTEHASSILMPKSESLSNAEPLLNNEPISKMEQASKTESMSKTKLESSNKPEVQFTSNKEEEIPGNGEKGTINGSKTCEENQDPSSHETGPESTLNRSTLGEPQSYEVDNAIQERAVDEIIEHSRMSSADFLARQVLPPDFKAKFAAFCHLRDLGYFMMPGLRFGGVFVAYPGDPLQFHSHLIVKVLEEGKDEGRANDDGVNLLELVTSGRLATAVKKAWVIMGRNIQGFEENRNEERDNILEVPTSVRAYSIEWAGFG